MAPPSDELVFLEEDAAPLESGSTACPWRILVVDDDPDVHEATRFALADTVILHRPLSLLHAHSAAEAIEMLRRERNIAVILLDVVMESEDAGLRTVDTIRNELKLENVRIILRTGQPGQAPEVDTITRYDINDYKTKSELTRTKLFTTLTAAIRSYDQLLRLDANRRGLEKIVSASNQFLAEQGLHAFAEGVITQIASLIGVEPEGLVCAAVEDSGDGNTPGEFRVIAAAGQFRHLIQHRLTDIGDARIVGQLQEALSTHQSVVRSHSITLYFRKTPEEGFAAFIDSATPIRDVDRNLLEVFCTNIALCAKNIDLVAELRRDAFFDRQMGLPNRTALVCELNNRMTTERDTGCALAIIDLDQFSAANDAFGSDYGDMLLKLTAQRLRDRLPPDSYIARLAGDAFAIIGPHGAISADGILGCFADPLMVAEIRQPVSVCAGIVRLGSGRRSGIEYLKDSYLALKRAKARGLGQAVVYSDDLGTRARERSQLLGDLRLAFDQEQLFLTYQPQMDLASGRVIGAEALLRWRRDDGQLVSPERFIPIAEQSGLIVGMGSWLLQASLLALRRFRAAGFPHLRMAVNISSVQLRQPNFLDLVHEALRQTDSQATDLELEITESVAVGGLEPVVDLLTQLRALGVTVAIDDFGTGYSSLSYLDRLPADRLKIDRSFVHALERNDHGTRIARTIIVLGRELGLKVIAEGVENQSLADLVVGLGCNEAQGFHYARPMPEEDFIAWLQRQREGQG